MDLGNLATVITAAGAILIGYFTFRTNKQANTLESKKADDNATQLAFQNLNELYKGVVSRLDTLQHENELFRAENQRLSTENAKLKKEVANLKARIKKLESEK